jgi:hypothetical protein
MVLIYTPILHLKAKIATKWISRTIGKSGFGFYMCKIKVIQNLIKSKNVSTTSKYFLLFVSSES